MVGFDEDFDLGVLRLLDDDIEYSAHSREGWRIKLADLILIGEWLEDTTLAPTPMDRWWVFVQYDGSYYLAPILAAGNNFFENELSARLGCSLTPSMIGTGLASRIMWPSELADVELFTYRPLKAEGILQRMREWFCGQNAEVSLTAQVQDYIARHGPPTR